MNDNGKEAPGEARARGTVVATQGAAMQHGSKRTRGRSVDEDQPILSFVIPCRDEDATIAETVRSVGTESRRLGRTYEVIVVDDGSRDQTVRAAMMTLSEEPLRVLILSRNFGKEQAMAAGLEAARGEAVVILDADRQEPVSCLETMLDHWDRGDEIVYAVRAARTDESWWKRLGARVFYWVLGHSTSVSIPPHARDFRVLDRKVVDALNAMPERTRFTKGLCAWVGFRTRAVPIEMRPRRYGNTKFGMVRLLALALTSITAFSDRPLRLWTAVGLGVAILAGAYAVTIAVRTLLFGNPLPGWATLVTAVSFLGGLQLLSIGILGEYVARIFTEVKARPGFIVSRTIDYRDYRGCPS